MNGWILLAAKRLFCWLVLLKTHVCSCTAVWVRTDEWSERANGWWWTFPVLGTGDVQACFCICIWFHCLCCFDYWESGFSLVASTTKLILEHWNGDKFRLGNIFYFASSVVSSQTVPAVQHCAKKKKYVSHERDLIPLKCTTSTLYLEKKLIKKWCPRSFNKL